MKHSVQDDDFGPKVYSTTCATANGVWGPVQVPRGAASVAVCVIWSCDVDVVAVAVIGVVVISTS